MTLDSAVASATRSTPDMLSVVARNGVVRARARATADAARISVEVWCMSEPAMSRRELWERARDEVLRYLDLPTRPLAYRKLQLAFEL